MAGCRGVECVGDGGGVAAYSEDRRIADEPRCRKVAAALCLIAPFAVYYSFGVASETPAYLAAAIFLYGWARWRMEGIPRLASLGAALALAGLIGLILCRLNTLVVLGPGGGLRPGHVVLSIEARRC